MNEINKILDDKNSLENKKLSQIISFLGEGKLKDGDNSFREFIQNINNDLLIRYAEECLDKGFNDSGLALQDIVNEIGKRLGFQIINGVYRGTKNNIGYDGIWKQYDGWSLLVEVKTTDAYRIPLNTIAGYRERLIDNKEFDEDGSSILIVVGRNDTGELEAQIRGSKHAWDIRIISVDSLIRLLRIKESLSDESTAQKISIALRPYEYTRVDKLIELLFMAIKDIEIEENVDELVEDNDESENNDKVDEKKFTPVNFHEPVFNRIKEILDKNFIKQTKSSYSSNDGEIGIVISISKKHKPYNSKFDARYWFAFHPHQDNFLKKHRESYICYGCGNSKTVFMLPYDFLKSKTDYMWETKGKDREYKHIVIYQENNNYFLRTNIDSKEHYDDLEKYRI
jgi:hypothetical protein